MTPSRSEPAYARIARELVDAIGRGELAVGQWLPTEVGIAERFGVSRHTAREALRRVEALGLVDRRRGAGTRVKAERPARRFGLAAQTIEDLLAYGQTSRLRLIRVRRKPAGREAAALLGIAEGTPVVRIDAERLEAATDEPVGLTVAWVLAGADRDTEALLDRKRSVPSLLARFDLDRLARVEQTFSVGLAGADAARRLGIRRGAPVLVVKRRYFGHDGHLLLATSGTHRGDRFTFSNVLARQDAN
jgi:DNA-binding GntR family transcriptional regulator